MNELAVVDKGAVCRRLKALVLDSVSSPITKRVYNLGLDECLAWDSQEPRPSLGTFHFTDISWTNVPKDCHSRYPQPPKGSNWRRPYPAMPFTITGLERRNRRSD